jgi:pyruvate/2-oxoglutarate dehydrogenase complex dihydrolipoamide dehydrogenase (E3) component
LMKAKLLIETVVAGEPISKENWLWKKSDTSAEKTEAIQNQFKKENVTLIEDEADLQRYTSKKVSKSTQEIDCSGNLWIVGRKEFNCRYRYY